MGAVPVLVNQESLPEDCHLSRSLKEVGEPTVGSSGARSGAGRGNSRCRMPEAGVCTARHSGGQCGWLTVGQREEE